MSNIYANGKMLRHVGMVGDKRCVVVLQLPEETESVHVIDTDALPDQYHQTIMSILQSNDAQNTTWLGDVLSRRIMPDGDNALKALYQRRFIKVVPVDQVMMVPRPNQHIPLSQVISFMNGSQEVSEDNISREMQVIRDKEQSKLNNDHEDVLVNQHLENLSSDDNEQRKAQARNLVVEANMLKSEVDRKLAAAYNLDPSLRPKEVNTTMESTSSVNTDDNTNQFVDPDTGKSYKSEAALKAAITRKSRK